MAKGMSVGEAQRVRDRCVIGMRVELEHVERLFIRSHHGEADRMVPSEHDWKRTVRDHALRKRGHFLKRRSGFVG